MHFGRVITAMVTPFDAELNIDFQKVTMLIEHLLANGTESILIHGTTGESSVLTDTEKQDMLKHVVKVVNDRVPVIVGTGTNDTKKSVEQTMLAESNGAHAVMSVTPYYNKPSQQGLYEHFAKISAATKLPVMLYNIPSRTGVCLEAETILKLSLLNNIVALKEASGDLALTSRIIKETDEHFKVYSGDDSMTLPVLAIGGYGIVSVASHIIGQKIQEMIQAFNNGEVHQASQLHLKYLQVMKGLFAAPSPAPVKAALQMQKIDAGGVRLPLLDLSEEQLKQLKKVITT